MPEIRSHIFKNPYLGSAVVVRGVPVVTAGADHAHCRPARHLKHTFPGTQSRVVVVVNKPIKPRAKGEIDQEIRKFNKIIVKKRYHYKQLFLIKYCLFLTPFIGAEQKYSRI